MAKNDAMKRMHIQQGDLVLADKNLGAEAQYVDVSYDENDQIIEDINATGVEVEKTEALSTTLKNMKGVVDDAVVWKEMNILGSKNMLPMGTSGTIAGITYTVQKDGSIRINGKPNVEEGSQYSVNFPKPINEACYFTIDCANFSEKRTGADIKLLNSNGANIKWFGATSSIPEQSTLDGTAQLEIPENSDIATFKIFIPYQQDIPTIDFTIYPMVRLQSITDRTYEPYAKTNQELTRDLIDFKKPEAGAAVGTHGLVPAPTSADLEKFLKGDGTWAEAAARLAQLKDVSISNVNIGDQLTYAGGEWTGKGDSSVLNHNGSWENVKNNPALPITNPIGTLPFLYHGTIYAFLASSGVYEYKLYALENNTWVVKANSPLASDRQAATNLCVYDNKIWIIEGSNSGSTYGTGKVYYWNSTDSQWHSDGTLPTPTPGYYPGYGGYLFVDPDSNTLICAGGFGTADSRYWYKDNNSGQWIARTYSSIPSQFYFFGGVPIEFHDTFYIIGNYYTNKIYKMQILSPENISVVEGGELPFTFNRGGATVYRDKVYLIGGYNGLSSTSTATKSYSSNDLVTWTQLSDLPWSNAYVDAITYDDAIWIVGGGQKIPYTYTGGLWSQSFKTLFSAYTGIMKTYNGELHFIGGEDSYNSSAHYSWKNSSWYRYYDLQRSDDHSSINICQGCSVVYEGKLHILGGKVGGNPRQHLAWENDTEGWKAVTTLPYDFYQGCAVVYNGEIHILGGGTSGNNVKHKVRRTTAQDGWATLTDLPYAFNYGAAVVYDNKIHIMGGSSGSTNHYAWDGIKWTQVSTLPYSFSHGKAVVWNNEIHIFGSAVSGNTTKHYAWDGSNWIQISTLSASYQDESVEFFNDKIYIAGGSTPDNAFRFQKFNATGTVNGLHAGLCPSTSSTNPRFVHSLDKSSNASAFLKGNNTWQDIGIKSGEVNGPIDNTTGADITVSSGELALLICYAYKNSNSYFKQIREYILIGGNSGGKSQIIPSVIGTAGTTGGISTALSTTGDYKMTIKAYSSAYRVKYLLLKFKNFT